MDARTTVSRRSFVSSAACLGAGAAGLAGASLVTQAHASEKSAAKDAASGFTFADTIAWNAEYDVVVVGFGGAGGVAATYAADNGARILICDVAPEGHEGGNTRVACQMMVAGTDPDKTFEYYKAMAWHFNTDDELLRTYTDNLCKMKEHLAYLGADEPFAWPGGTVVTPEYPEYESGLDNIYELFVHQSQYDSALWKLIRANVTDRADKIDVWYEAPAVHLIQDPQSKTVVGVEIDKAGETVLVRAINGVVLSCGGFENNKEMIQDYLGAPRFLPIGGLYNNGDGVRMGIEVGADLWHMEAFESLGILNGNAWAAEEGGRAVLEPSYGSSVSLISLGSEEYGQGSIMLVGDDGSRFTDETEMHRHGHVYSCGVWRNPIANYTPHLIFDQTELDFLKEKGRMTAEREALLVSAATPEELAEKIGADPAVLAQTIADFNFFAESGRDYKQNRPADTMRAFDGGTYFAAEFRPAILNTQGGPRRNKNAEVVNTAGTPIPHLYSAGELGGLTPFQYNSGGNLAECVIFGMIAGINAAEVKDALPAVEIPAAVEPAITYTPGQAAAEEEPVELAEGQYLGTSTAGMGNELQLKVTYEGDAITAVEVVKQSETPEYGGKALDALTAQAVETGSPDVDVVAGATMTSAAFLGALADAAQQAGK